MLTILLATACLLHSPAAVFTDQARMVYAARLAKVQNGMTEAHAIRVVGEPEFVVLLESGDFAKKLIGYSFSGSDVPLYGSFQVNNDGRVVAVFGQKNPAVLDWISPKVLNEFISDILELPGIALGLYRAKELLLLRDRLRKFSPQQVSMLIEEYLRVAPVFYEGSIGARVFQYPRYWQNSGRVTLLAIALLGTQSESLWKSYGGGFTGPKPPMFCIDNIPVVLSYGLIPYGLDNERTNLASIKDIQQWPEVVLASNVKWDEVRSKALKRIKSMASNHSLWNRELELLVTRSVSDQFAP